MSRALVSNPCTIEPLDLLKQSQENLRCSFDDIFTDQMPIKPEFAPKVDNNQFIDEFAAQKLDIVCGRLEELAENQRETNRLLKLFIQSKHTNHNSNNNNNSLSYNTQTINIPDIVYMKRRGMSMLVSLSKNSRKVWCTECNKKVSVTKTNSNVQTKCGHYVSCTFCRDAVISDIFNCSHCNPSYSRRLTIGNELNGDLTSKCPVCDTEISHNNNNSNVFNDFLDNSFVLVNCNDENQCNHAEKNKIIKKRKRSEMDAPDSSPPAKKSMYEPLSYLTNQISASSPMVYDGVMGIGKRAFEVLNRMTYYEENENDSLFIL